MLKKERLVYIGLRDVDSGEKKILRENGQSYSTATECCSGLTLYE